MTLRSGVFDDVYFSAEDGLAETRHVFLAGNSLPEAFDGADEFVIGETGFGTGLNFLAVWKLFEETAKAGARLHFMSVEKFPLSTEKIDDALAHWADLDEYRSRLTDVYPDEAAGVFEADFGLVKLTVYFDDVVD